MTRRSSPPVLLSLALLAGALACEPLPGPVVVEAIVRDQATGEYGLRDITLETPTDLWRGEGTRFYVLRDIHFDKALREEATNTSEHPTLEALINYNRQSSGGSPPSMSMHSDGQRYIADDFDTLMLLSAWVSLERTLDFFESIGDTSGATRAPLLVAQYGQVTGLGLPEVAADNAAYLALADGMFLFPTWLLGDLQGQLPLPANEGIIAHELGHRMFFYNVFSGVAEPLWRANIAGDLESVPDSNRLRGINEGLADLFAVGVTGDPRFGEPSGLGEDRNLDADAARNLTYDDAVSGTASCASGGDIDNPSFSVYCLGTTVASVIWESAGGDLNVYRGEILPALVRALPRMGARMQDDLDATGELRVDVPDLFEPLVSELGPGTTRDALCAGLSARMSSRFGEVPSCP